MKIGIVGAGRMGGNIARRLLRAGHEVMIQDLNPEMLVPVVEEGGVAAATLADLVAGLEPPRAVWVMVPHGVPTNAAIEQLGQLLSAGDTVIDGGNSHYRETVAHAQALRARGLYLLDVGTSGGTHGLERGYCLMVGGEAGTVTRLAPIFEALAPGIGDIPRTPARDRGLGTGDSAERGWMHCGPSGSGHYVKMIHNGIEYGMMQALAEGFALLDSADSTELPADLRYALDLGAIAELWRRGSVVTSWLLDLAADALAETPDLNGYAERVSDSGEGRWTVESAIDQRTPIPVLTAALYERFRSRQDARIGDRLLSALRFKFGGHGGVER